MTEDVDILVEDSIENFQRVIAGLSAIEDYAAAELTPQDIEENVVVKIADEVEVEVSRQTGVPPAASGFADRAGMPRIPSAVPGFGWRWFPDS